VIRELRTETEETEDPEVEYAVAGVLTEGAALPLLVQRLAWTDGDYDHSEFCAVLRLLDQAVHLQVHQPIQEHSETCPASP
jgi:hypothetical protein